MDHPRLLIELLILLGAAVAVALPLHRLGLPLLLGYMAVGVLVGPHALDLLPREEETRTLAELGVVFLMFTVGLDFSFGQMLRARRNVLGLGGAQVVVTTLVMAGGASLAGRVPLLSAIILGGALAMSSTAIGLEQLSEQGELNSRHGRKVFGVLLFQDLASLPFLMAISAAGPDAAGEDPLRGLARGALGFLLLPALGRWVWRPAMARISATRSDELFVLTALLGVLGAATLADLAGLSKPIGAFLVGSMLGESRFRHQIADDVRPFRDVLLGLFFVTVGMRLNPESLLAYPGSIALVLAGLVLVKGLVVAGLVSTIFPRSSERPEAVRTALVLAHGGELGLLMTTFAFDADLLPPSIAQPVLAGLILSMVLAPFLIRWNEAITRRLLPSTALLPAAQEKSLVLRDHVLLCGYGNVGRHLASLLDTRDIPLEAIEMDLAAVRDAEESGHRVRLGDASRLSVLTEAGLEGAQCVVVTLSDVDVARRVVEQVRGARSEVPVLASVARRADVDALMVAGATHAIPEGLSASLMLGEDMLRHSGVPPAAAREAVDQLRAELGPRDGLR